MREFFVSITRERMLEIAAALALGTAFATLVAKLAEIPVAALGQHVGRNPYGEPADVNGLLNLFYAPQLLNVSLGETVVVYGDALTALLALGLVALAAILVVRRRDSVLEACPFCAARIPVASRHCAYCGSGLSTDEQ
jgi:large-conductance mechanosensitive channel